MGREAALELDQRCGAPQHVGGQLGRLAGQAAREVDGGPENVRRDRGVPRSGNGSEQGRLTGHDTGKRGAAVHPSQPGGAQ